MADARRHGVTVHGPCVQRSGAGATLAWPLPGRGIHLDRRGGSPVGPQPAVRLGLAAVRNVGVALAERLVAEREAGGPFRDLGDLVRRTDAPRSALEALATAGALDALVDAPVHSAHAPVHSAHAPADAAAATAPEGPSHAGAPSAGSTRRRALWAVGALVHDRPGHLPGVTTGVHAPSLPGMDEVETMAADLWATGVTPDGYRPNCCAPGSTSSGWWRRRRSSTWSTDRGSGWRASSRTASVRRRPGAPRS